MRAKQTAPALCPTKFLCLAACTFVLLIVTVKSSRVSSYFKQQHIQLCSWLMQDLSWNAGKKMMGNVDAFLKSLVSFDKDNVPLQCVEKCEKDYLSNSNFNADYIRNKSGAAAGLCGWVVNICKYFRIYQVFLSL